MQKRLRFSKVLLACFILASLVPFVLGVLPLILQMRSQLINNAQRTLELTAQISLKENNSLISKVAAETENLSSSGIVQIVLENSLFLAVAEGALKKMQTRSNLVRGSFIVGAEGTLKAFVTLTHPELKLLSEKAEVRAYMTQLVKGDASFGKASSDGNAIQNKHSYFITDAKEILTKIPSPNSMSPDIETRVLFIGNPIERKKSNHTIAEAYNENTSKDAYAGALISVILFSDLLELLKGQILPPMQLRFLHSNENSLENSNYFLTSSLPMRYGSHTINMEITQPRTHALLDSNRTTSVLVLVSFVILGFAALGGYLVCKALLRPFAVTDEIAAHYQSENYLQSRQTSRFLEFDLLLSTFHQLGQRVHNSISHLKLSIKNLKLLEQANRRVATLLEHSELIEVVDETINILFQETDVEVKFFLLTRYEEDNTIFTSNDSEKLAIKKEMTTQDGTQESSILIFCRVNMTTDNSDTIYQRLPAAVFRVNAKSKHLKGSPETGTEDTTLHLITAYSHAVSGALQNIISFKKSKDLARLDVELGVAKAVQAALLPTLGGLPNVEIETWYHSATQTGGDWYGYHYSRHQDRFYFYIGDVTGHGIPAALLTGVAFGAICAAEALAENNQNQLSDPRKVLLDLACMLNQVVLRTGQKKFMMTMSFLSLDVTTGIVTYINAAHTTPFVINPSSKSVKGIKNSGSCLGFSDTPRFKIEQFQLLPGDIVFTYTDGLLENRGPDERIFKEKHLKELLSEVRDIQHLKATIVAEAASIWQDKALDDDVSFMAFRWAGPLSEKRAVD